ncbi:hypothetical protein jhhlp_003450 [Lomentospora prolificans]|uniref:Uncharacterized protein n=1 Tax=Lomentospora prolificans TaxID=41688 RepID=A0A2N3N8S4_9PEZI|nr:hypothetical protein jhhlp_003450 [Lomentospora prolificans]
MTSRLSSPTPQDGGDSFAYMAGYIPATDYARAYYSDHLLSNHETLIPLLSHLNCDYFSHPGGKPPTLLALKKHAQALTILIRAHSISTRGGDINASNSGTQARRFIDGEAFDWLNDLTKPYENSDPSHHTPLTSLMNHIRKDSDTTGPEFHCPFEEYMPQDPSADRPMRPRPYQTHHGLLMHANDCLEILDHEYGATGGFMSILPTDDKRDAKEMKAARNSLVGQWLLFTQHLVGRMHELEISYGQSLDVLAGEAAVPLQMVGRAGPTKHTGREIGFPQDRWVLANAGDDVFEYLHQLFDKQENRIQADEEIWKDAGVSGQRMWMEDLGGKELSRGMVTLDIQTRYYRLKNAGKSTIFIIPAWEFHPACKFTKEIESRPTVVAVPAPQWPPRVSDWEARARSKLDEAEGLARDNNRLIKNMNDQRQMNSGLIDQLKKTTSLIKSYEAAFPENTQQQIVRLDALLQKYREKLAFLATTLPEQYHQHLAM